MKLTYDNVIYEKLNYSKNDLVRWVQMIGKGMMPFGGDITLSAKVYANYNLWELAVLEATKSLVKKYKKKGITIKREIKNGKKKVIVEFPDELKDEILEQLLPQHITFEEVRKRMVKKVRNYLQRITNEKMLKKNYDLAYEMFEKNKDSNHDLMKRFTYWYFFNAYIYTELNENEKEATQ